MKPRYALCAAILSFGLFSAGYLLGSRHRTPAPDKIGPSVARVGTPGGFRPAPAIQPGPAAQPLPNLRESDGERAFYEFERYVAHLRTADLPQVLAQLRTVYPLQRRERYWRILFRAWGRRDGAAACAAVNQLPPEYRNEMVDVVLGAWAQVSPQNAVAWLKQSLPPPTPQHPTTGLRGRRLDAIAEGLLESGEPLLAASLLEDPELPEGNVVTLGFARAWAEQDVNGATSWAISLPPGSAARANALKGVVTAITEEDPALAAKFVHGLTDPAERTLGYTGMCETLQSDGNVDAQLALFRDNTADPNLDFARASFVEANISADSNSALQVLRSISQPAAKAAALQSALASLRGSHPAEAAAVAEDNLSAQALVRALPPILKAWSKSDASAPVDFIDRLGITDRQRQFLARYVTGGKH